jgi:hypothetical protein
MRMLDGAVGLLGRLRRGARRNGPAQRSSLEVRVRMGSIHDRNRVYLDEVARGQ